MRYCKEYEPYHQSTYELGDLKYINVTMAKSWEKYGIHALETLYPIVGPGFTSIQNLEIKKKYCSFTSFKVLISILLMSLI